MSKKTLASCEWARLSAHSLRYDAVLEMHPRANSIVWIIELIATAVMSNSSSPWPCPWPPRLPITFSSISCASNLSRRRPCTSSSWISWSSSECYGHKQSVSLSAAPCRYLLVLKYLIGCQVAELVVAAAGGARVPLRLLRLPLQERGHQEHPRDGHDRDHCSHTTHMISSESRS